ncbi:PAS domain S-box protein [Methanococcoides sp. SA1]|nr:PAS domain S-box protein [Methanococcoides sp. SA1]
MVGDEDILNDLATEGSYNIPFGSGVNMEILKSIFDDIPLIMILVNHKIKIENINRAATIGLGKEKKDSFDLLVGEALNCINSFKGTECGKNSECSECIIRNSVIHTFETGENIYKKEGEVETVVNGQPVTLYYFISTILIRDENGPKVALIIDDISEIKQTNRIIKRKLEIERMVASISSKFIFSKDIDANIDYALENICNLCGSNRSYIFQFRENGTRADNTHECCVDGVEPQKENLQNVPLDQYPWWMSKLYRDEAIHIKDVSALPPEASAEKEILMAQDIRSLIVLPLHIKNELAGFIGIDNVLSAGECNEKDLVILNMAAHIIGSALESKQADVELKKSEEKYSNLVEKGNDGIIIIQDYVLKYANKKMSDISGYSIEEIIGKPLINFVSPKYRDLVKDRYEKRICGDQIPNYYEIEIISKDGENVLVEINASIIEYEGRPADMAIIRDLTERKQIENALQISEEKYHRLSESINDIIFCLDPDTLVATYVNPAIEQIYGYTVEEWLNDPALWQNTLYSEDMDWVIAKTKELQTKLEDGILEYRIINKDGNIRWVKAKLSWDKDQQGKPLSLNGIISDITETVKAQDAMLQAKILAEDSNKSKSEFIMNMSHEIRTPLNSIIGFSNVLLKRSEGLDEKKAKYVKNILSNGKHLLEIFNEIITTSKIESGVMEFRPTKFLIANIIDEVETSMMSFALEKDIILTHKIDLDNTILKADKFKFKHIIYNLVHNAIKFTPNGGHVTIETKICGDSMCFFVKDTGSGISPTDQSKLFDKFFQADSSTTRKHGGIGLGLNIVKKFVEIHNGKVWVESEVGNGSTFGFSMPIDLESAS